MIKKMLAVTLLLGVSGGVLLGMKMQSTGCVDVSSDPGAKVLKDERREDIDGIPRMCVDLMLKLLAQLEHDGNSRGGSTEMCKTMPVELIAGEICAILNHNLERPLKVYAYEEARRASENSAKNTLIFWLPKSWEPPVDYDHLLLDYQEIIEKLKVGWNPISADKTGSIFDGKPLADKWFAFIKKKILKDEARLINKLAERLGFASRVGASDADIWLGETEGKVYLWIREDVFDEFNRIFKFYYQP